MDFERYKITRHYPRSTKFTTTYFYKEGKCIATLKPGEELPADVDVKGCLRESIVDDDAFNQAKMLYSAESVRLETQFKIDLFEDLGIEDHPMREKLYAKAYESGHPHGHEEVYNCAQSLVELIELPIGSVLVSQHEVYHGRGLSKDAKSAQLIEDAIVNLQEALKR